MTTAKFTRDGKYLMLALDHRNSFKKLMNEEHPEIVTDAEAIDLKHQIITSVIKLSSGVLIDPDYGLPAYGGFTKPFLLPLEASGYESKQGERFSRLKYSAEWLRSQGASGAKLLLYFYAKGASAEHQLDIARRAMADCRAHGFPLFIEIVNYSPVTGDRLDKGVVVQSLERFWSSGIKPDVYKLEFPGDRQACEQVSQLLGGQVPWILLTRGVQFTEFVSQLEMAVAGGAVGFLAGRALWQEAASLEGAQRADFLNRSLPERYGKLNQIVLKHGA